MAKTSKKKKKANSKSKFITNKKIAVVVLSFLSAFFIVYAVNYFQLFSHKSNLKDDNIESTQVLMDKMKKMLDEEKKRVDELPKYIHKKEVQKLPPVVVTKDKEIAEDTHFSEINDYRESLKKSDKEPEKIKVIKKEKYTYSGKPKLAIIIDDVAFTHQISAIKKIPYKVSPSFFPPTDRHPDTVALSKKFDFALVHLPAQALKYSKSEPSTLNVGDSLESIRARIKQIKQWFPNIQYYNNHTGSKFTSDYDSMDKLYRVMKEENLYFVDSRTTANTKAEQVAQKYNMPLYSRDVFIDNSVEKNLIKEQIKKAIKIAKKRGYAIAIGHPHVNTLEVLRGAKNMFKDVELVYLKDI